VKRRLSVNPIAWKNGKIRIIDQTRLPVELKYEDCVSVRDIWGAIRKLRVRGAPLIGIAGALAELSSAWVQGLIGAAGCRSISEGQGKGLVFIIIAMGIVETVGLFGFVFLLLVLPK